MGRSRSSRSREQWSRSRCSFMAWMPAGTKARQQPRENREGALDAPCLEAPLLMGEEGEYMVASVEAGAGEGGVGWRAKVRQRRTDGEGELGVARLTLGGK